MPGIPKIYSTKSTQQRFGRLTIMVDDGTHYKEMPERHGCMFFAVTIYKYKMIASDVEATDKTLKLLRKEE